VALLTNVVEKSNQGIDNESVFSSLNGIMMMISTVNLKRTVIYTVKY
jgi:hypothetical protein